MTIFSNSRYRNIDTLQIDLVGGDSVAVYELRPTTVYPEEGLRIYTTRAGDTFEKLADLLFGDGNKWYVLADLNPQIFWPLDLVAGVQIALPTKVFAAMS